MPSFTGGLDLGMMLSHPADETTHDFCRLEWIYVVTECPWLFVKEPADARVQAIHIDLCQAFSFCTAPSARAGIHIAGACLVHQLVYILLLRRVIQEISFLFEQGMDLTGQAEFF